MKVFPQYYKRVFQEIKSRNSVKEEKEDGWVKKYAFKELKRMAKLASNQHKKMTGFTRDIFT